MIAVFTETRHRDKPRPSRSVATLTHASRLLTPRFHSRATLRIVCIRQRVGAQRALRGRRRPESGSRDGDAYLAFRSQSEQMERYLPTSGAVIAVATAESSLDYNYAAETRRRRDETKLDETRLHRDETPPRRDATVMRRDSVMRRDETPPRRDETLPRRDDTRLYRDETIRDSTETRRYETLPRRDSTETRLCPDETRLYRDETRLYREETRLYRDETRLYRDETRLYRDKTSPRRDSTETRLYRDATRCEVTSSKKWRLCLEVKVNVPLVLRVVSFCRE
ncbi:hypothetical protein EYF80_031542 [Liparis tanakae]|uniref:Uncharacterized protein n=1 Tax=Liparis tanakae TaxID=230148 RepID=A0A4Z2GY94_9TELE|nr:hypothetical protein EYF80_031542 [Liparis tanakae]